MAPQQISARVIVETEHFGSNNSVIVNQGDVILVDAPHRLSDALAWADYVSTLGSVRFLVNSDHHPDHTIGNYVLPGEVVSHSETRRRLLTEAPSREYLRDLMARLDPDALEMLADYEVRVPTVTFDAALSLHLGDVTLELRHQPGHTRNSILSYLPEDKVLFSGDIVCEAGFPSFQDSRLSDWFDALDAVDAYDYEFVVPGHGQVTDRAGVERYRSLGREIVAVIADHIAKGHEKDQVVAEVRFVDNIHVATNTCAGYPDDLIETFQIRSIARLFDDLHELPSLVQR